MTRLEHLNDVWRRAHADEPKAKAILPALMHEAWPVVAKAANRAVMLAESTLADDATDCCAQGVEAIDDTEWLREEVNPVIIEHKALVQRTLAGSNHKEG